MTDINTWAARWRIDPAALADLHCMLGALDQASPLSDGSSEAAVQARVRVAASAAGMRLWRNNVGAFHDDARGIHVRFGLANDSKQVNNVIKSADLIGIRPRLITLTDVGRRFGQFVSLECKSAGWRYTGTERERAQEAWAALITSLGGVARFVSGVEGIPR